MTQSQTKIVSYIKDYYENKEVLPAITSVAKRFRRHTVTIYDHLHRAGISYQTKKPEFTMKQINKVLKKK